MVGNVCRFSLWAPGADAVSLTVVVDGIHRSRHEMVYTSAEGLWTHDHEFPEGAPGSVSYQYEICRDGTWHPLVDPWAKAAYPRTRNGSMVHAVLPGDAQSAQHRKHESLSTGGGIVYELHVRDASVADSRVRASQRGTYLGLIPRLDDIAALGATHVQLMPLQLFDRSDERAREFERASNAAHHNYNWGYDPIQYFIPSGLYSETPDDALFRLHEVKTMVSEAHARGLRVILDVVYNHSSSTKNWELIAPGYWFRRTPEGRFTSNSGCGNDFDSHAPMYRRLLRESLSWWLDYFDVDGFRFDLLGLMDEDCFNETARALRRIKRDVLLLGEGWRMYNGPAGTRGMDQDRLKGTRIRVSMFSDETRDLAKGGGLDELRKGFLHFHARSAPEHPESEKAALVGALVGCPRRVFTSSWTSQSVQYLECHDGLTLHDNLCVHLPELSEQEVQTRVLLGNILLSFAHGVIFLHAGQEWGRSKRIPDRLDGENRSSYEPVGAFCRNSYRAGDEINALPDILDESRIRMRQELARFLKFRGEHPAFRNRRSHGSLSRTRMVPSDSTGCISWIYRTASWPSRKGDYLFVVNLDDKPARLFLPAPFSKSGWIAEIVGGDAESSFLAREYSTGGQVTVPPASAAVFRRTT